MESNTEHVRATDVADEQDDRGAIDLGRLVRTVWGYRRFIALTTLAVLVAYALFLLASYLVSPVRQEASVVFELPFLRRPGPDGPRYPSGAKFANEDILALPVLQEVYVANELSRYGTFANFRSGLALTKSSVRLEMLASEFRARLSEGRLTSAERARIESEFESRRAALMSEPSFELTFRRQSRLREMPDLLLGKVLADVLGVWARQSAQRKGVLRQDVVIFNAGSLREDYRAATEPVVAVDVLRTRGRRMLLSLTSLAEIPGAWATRIGDSRLSLGDTTARIEDVIALCLEPALAQLLDAGVAVSPDHVRTYLESRAMESRNERDEVSLRVQALRRSLAAQAEGPWRRPGVEENDTAAPPPATVQPSGSAPPIGSSFLDSLMQLATRQQDLTFRQRLVDRLLDEQTALARSQAEQEYYERLVARNRSASSGRASFSAEARAQVDGGLAVLEGAAESVRVIHTQLVERGVTPATRLYTVTQPAVVTSSDGLSQARITQMIGLILLACLFFLPALCLVHASLEARTQEER